MQNIVKVFFIGVIIVLAGYITWLNVGCESYHVSQTTFKVNSQRVNLFNYEYFKKCGEIPDSSRFYSQKFDGARSLGSCHDLVVPIVEDDKLQDHFGNFLLIKNKKVSQRGISYKIKSLGNDDKPGGKSLAKDLVEDYFLFADRI